MFEDIQPDPYVSLFQVNRTMREVWKAFHQESIDSFSGDAPAVKTFWFLV
uniref:Uncharacterized protein n=1 Tax=Nelumbo nucifera TaxID=4432 RepID=A0A822YGM7_NELNU|nr:TPA_asm: hypothetical protein HUJ06_012195 [Nelumbo nucifera]